MGLIAPSFKGQRLSWGSVIAIGVVSLLSTFGFGAVGLFALSTADAGIPPQFGYGMLAMAVLCLLGGVACFVPSSRWWVLPLLACLIGAFMVVVKLAKDWVR
jgi:hypothetical protein